MMTPPGRDKHASSRSSRTARTRCCFNCPDRHRPKRRSLRCNTPLRAVDKAQVAARLPPGVCMRHERFAVCDGCARVFWEGSHWRRMHERVDALLVAAAS